MFSRLYLIAFEKLISHVYNYFHMCMMMKIFSSKEGRREDDGEEKKSKGEQAKELLAKYGGAYLATSITLSLISFSLCYALISAGVDVQALLQKVRSSNQISYEASFYYFLSPTYNDWLSLQIFRWEFLLMRRGKRLGPLLWHMLHTRLHLQ